MTAPRRRRHSVAEAPVASVQGETVVPNDYRPDALDFLLERVAAGEQLVDVCHKHDTMPPAYLVRRWLTNDPAFKTKYIDALRAHALEEGSRLMAIADGETKLIREVEDPETGEIHRVYETEGVQRSSLRVKTRLELLKRLEPQVFGDRVENVHDVGGELATMLKGAMNRGHRLPGDTS